MTVIERKQLHPESSSRNGMEQKKRHVELETPDRGCMVKSSIAFIEVTCRYIMSTVLDGKLSKEKASCYIKEILHSIFFLGYINRPHFYPEDVLSMENALHFKQKFPDVFQTYMTHLPSRPPYSALLDMVVETTGRMDSAVDQNEYEVFDKLLDLNKKMYVPQHQNRSMTSENAFCLASAVVSYCFFLDAFTGQKTKKYFGVSIACKGNAQREIFIDLSCIKTWNRNVALSVCLVASGNHPIVLPPYVRCAAFRMSNGRWRKQASAVPCISDYNTAAFQTPEGNISSDFRFQSSGSDTVEPMSSQPSDRGLSFRQLPTQISETDLLEFCYYSKPPCSKCLQIFPNVQFPSRPHGLPVPAWEYGNCAECEAISKLLNAEQSVNTSTFLPPINSVTDLEFRQFSPPVFLEFIFHQRRLRLACNLIARGFECRDFQFYSP